MGCCVSGDVDDMREKRTVDVYRSPSPLPGETPCHRSVDLSQSVSSRASRTSGKRVPEPTEKEYASRRKELEDRARQRGYTDDMEQFEDEIEMADEIAQRRFTRDIKARIIHWQRVCEFQSSWAMPLAETTTSATAAPSDCSSVE